MAIRLNNLDNIVRTSFLRTQNNRFLKASRPFCLNGVHVDTVALKRFSNIISIKHQEYGGTLKTDTKVMLNPNNRGTIYKKIYDKNGRLVTKEPVIVNVAHSEAQDSVFDQFYFLDKNTNEEIGYVQFFNSKNSLKNDKAKAYYCYFDNTFSRDYSGYGISKDRLIIEMACNHKEKEYGGIGKLVDQLAVEFCLKNGIKPRSIISEAGFSSHSQHYKRGRRFMKDAKYGDVNSYINNLINTALPDEKFDTNELGYILMYFPKPMVKRILEDIKMNPILRA